MKDGHPVEEAVGERPPVVAAPPCVMVVFGAGGDLTRRKLMPALINLRRGGLLTDDTRVVAMTRPGVEEMGFRAKLLDDASGFLEPALSPDERGWLDSHLSLIFGNLDDPATYESLRAELDRARAGPRAVLSGGAARRCSAPSPRAWATPASIRARFLDRASRRGGGSSSRSRSAATSPRPAP